MKRLKRKMDVGELKAKNKALETELDDLVIWSSILFEQISTVIGGKFPNDHEFARHYQHYKSRYHHHQHK